MSAIIKALTTKTERNCLKHNYRFMLGEDKEISTTSESDSVGYPATCLTSKFKLGKNLLNDVQKKCSINKG